MDANSTTVLRCRFLISGPHERRLRSVSRANYTLLDPPVTAILKGILSLSPSPSPSSLLCFFPPLVVLLSRRFSLPFSTFREYVGPTARTEREGGEFSRGQRSFSPFRKERGKERERERKSQSINIRRGKLQAETLMDPARAVLRPLMVGGDGDGDADGVVLLAGSRNADVGTCTSISLSLSPPSLYHFAGPG